MSQMTFALSVPFSHSQIMLPWQQGEMGRERERERIHLIFQEVNVGFSSCLLPLKFIRMEMEHSEF